MSGLSTIQILSVYIRVADVEYIILRGKSAQAAKSQLRLSVFALVPDTDIHLFSRHLQVANLSCAYQKGPPYCRYSTYGVLSGKPPKHKF
jgi:hypothetical protein